MVLNREVTTEEPETTEQPKKAKKAVDETTDTTTEVEKEDDTTTETEDIDKAGLEQNPSESAEAASQAGSTVTPGKQTGQAQDVFVPQSGIPGSRMGQGKTPGQESYSGKSANPDLMKSPLFVELSKNIESLKGAVSKKLEAVEKSMQDRLANIEKDLKKFYDQPFYKAVVDVPGNVGNAKGQETVAEKIGKGNARFVG